MAKHFRLLNRGPDIVGVAGKFLRDVWRQAGLKGMVVPRHGPGAADVRPVFAADWLLLDGVDPFAPVMINSAARLVAQAEHTQAHGRLGAVLRPCELRAVHELARRGRVDLDRWVLVGVECLGTFPAEDYAWRAAQWGVERLTDEMLQFARLGGILPYRYRGACQMCAGISPEGADLSLDVLGMPARQLILVTARDEATARRLRLDEVTDGPAPPALVDRHHEMRAMVAARHARAHSRLLGALAPDMPLDAARLREHLAECEPCEACLEACPLYDQQFYPLGDGGTQAGIEAWLNDCVACGLCEQACPRHMPLAAIFDCIKQRLPAETTPA